MFLLLFKIAFPLSLSRVNLLEELAPTNPKPNLSGPKEFGRDLFINKKISKFYFREIKKDFL